MFHQTQYPINQNEIFYYFSLIIYKPSSGFCLLIVNFSTCSFYSLSEYYLSFSCTAILMIDYEIILFHFYFVNQYTPREAIMPLTRKRLVEIKGKIKTLERI